DRGDEIERAIGEGQAGHGPLLDLDTALLDPSAVGAASDFDTPGGVGDAGELSVSGKRRPLVDRSASPAPRIQHRELFLDANMFEPPVGETGMARVHVPGDEAPEPTGRLAALAHHEDGCGDRHGNSDDVPENLRCHFGEPAWIRPSAPSASES